MKKMQHLQQQLGNSFRWGTTSSATEQCGLCLGTGTLPVAQCYVSRGTHPGTGGLVAGSSSGVACGAASSSARTHKNHTAEVLRTTGQQQQQQQRQQHQQLQHGQAVHGASTHGAGAAAASLTVPSAGRLGSPAWSGFPSGQTLLTTMIGSSALVGCGYFIGNASAESGHSPGTNTVQAEGEWELAAPPRSSSPTTRARQAISASSLSPFFIADAAAKVSPAVVNIRVRHIGQTADSSANGSGFIISSEGVVVTNTHVVSEAISMDDGGGAGSPGAAPCHAVIAVTLQDGRCFSAQLLNYDWQSDLAVLRVHPKAGPKLPVATLGRSRDLRAGEWVVALGSPLHLANSVSAGIVSAVRRRGADLGLSPASEFIQTDAACNVGSSGGPLVNVQGEVIGISNMQAIAADGVSFAIPIDSARLIIDQAQLIGSKQRPSHPHIGARTVQLSPAASAVLAAEAGASFPEEQPAGLYVSFVEAGGPAHRGGLRAGDTITGWPGHSQLTTSALDEAVRRHVGEPLPLSVSRSARGPIETLAVEPVLRQRSS